MRRKAVGPVCCVMLVKESSAFIVKRRGLPLCLWHGVIVLFDLMKCERQTNITKNLIFMNLLLIFEKILTIIAWKALRFVTSQTDFNRTMRPSKYLTAAGRSIILEYRGKVGGCSLWLTSGSKPMINGKSTRSYNCKTNYNKNKSDSSFVDRCYH